MSAPTFSIVTVAYNSARTIAATVRSVRSQSYTDLEHLLIDGASRDDTVALARRDGDGRLVVQSEPDRGIYDAMNKGLARARGRYTLFLNSDDRLSSADSLRALAEALAARSADVGYGDIRFVTAQGLSTRVWRPGRFRRHALSLGWTPPHPGFTANTELLRAVGGFSLAYNIAADYDLMLRVLARVPPRKVAYVPSELVVMEQGGESTASVGHMWRGLNQCAHSMRTNELPLWRVAAVLKPVRALGQVGNAAAAHAATLAKNLRVRGS